jgi:hypothetical protein
VLRTIKYVNTSQNPNATNRTVNFVVNDGSSNSNSPIATVTIVVVNDRPVVDMNGGTAGIDSGPVAFTEDSSPLVVGSGPVNLGSSATVTDVDSATLQSMTLTLTNHPDGVNESLSVTIPGTNPITTGGYNATTGELQLTGNGATTAQFQTVIQSAKYNNVSNTPNATDRTVDIQANDGAASNNLNSPLAHTTITVTPTNDAPVADDEATEFTGTNSAVGNTTFVGDRAAGPGTPATPDPSDTSAGANRPHKTVSGDIIAGDTDPEGATLTVTGETKSTADGGSVTIEPDGDFTFEPKAETSCTDHSDSFTYTINDGGSPNGSDVGQVNIDITGCAWYVNNNDAQGNDGTSEKPFDALSSVVTKSGTGDSIFVYKGSSGTTPYAGGIVLKTNQKLVGEAQTFVVGTDTLQTGDATKRPTLTNTASDVIALAGGTTVKGLDVDPAGGASGGGIFGTGLGATTVTIDDVNVTDTGTNGTQPGLEIDTSAGTTTNVSNFTASTASNATGIKLNSAGNVNFASSGTITSASAGGKALDAAGTNMGAGSVFDSLTSTNSTSGGVSMTTTTGTTQLGDGSGTDLNLTQTSGAGATLNLNNPGTVTVPGGGQSDIHAVPPSGTAGPAVDVQNAPNVALDLDTVESLNSASDGINWDNNGASTFVAGSGGTNGITGAAGIGIDVAGGSGNFNYPGALNDGNGTLTAEMTGRTGGTLTLSGQITDDNDNGGGISFTGNTGATAVVTNANNVVDTGSATAINVANTTIGASGINFQKVSSTGASNGINLDTTGSTGGLTVAGNGGTCSTSANCTGGAIQTSSAEGIRLSSVGGPVNLTRVFVGSGGNDGIRAATVGTSAGNGIALANSVIQNNGNAVGENGLDYDNVLGISSINNTTATGNGEFNARIDNDNGTGRFTVSSSAFNSNSSTFGADGMLLNGDGTAAVRALVQNSSFNSNRDDGFQLLANSDSSMDLQFNNNTVNAGGNAGAVSAHSALNFDSNTTSDVRMSMTGGTVSNNDAGISGSTIIVNPIGSTSTFDATFDNVTIGTAGVPGSGSATGQGFRVIPTQDTDAEIVIKNSHINGTSQNGMLLRHNDGAGDSDFTVTGNTIRNVGSGNEPIFVQSGSLGTDTTDVCADIGGAGGDNTNPPGNDFAGQSAGGVTDIAFRRPSAAAGAHLRLPGFSPPASTNLTPYIQGRNVGSPTAINFSGELEAGPASCQQPTAPTAP